MFKKIIIDGEKTCYSINENGQVRNDTTGKFLKGSILHSYRYVALRFNGKQKNKSVHRLVAEAFLPNPNNLPYVHHKDANRLNNCIENLEWVTEQENRQEALHPTGYKKYSEETNDKEGEIWRTYHDSVYQVSNLGRVRNTKSNKILKGDGGDCGYTRVSIQLPGEKRRKILVHQMVYETFVSSEYEVINHIDGNKKNNRLDNLEGITQQENMRKAAEETNAWGFRKVAQYDLEGNYIQTFPNASAAARSVNILPGSMRNAIRLREGKTQGFIFKYIENEDEASSTIPEGSRT